MNADLLSRNQTYMYAVPTTSTRSNEVVYIHTYIKCADFLLGQYICTVARQRQVDIIKFQCIPQKTQRSRPTDRNCRIIVVVSILDGQI